jgi:diguanylate cyclase (GGDEF)-like protein
MDEENLGFLIDDEVASQDVQLAPWIIGIIDDEPLVHQATSFALQGIEIGGRPLKFVSAFNGHEGYQLIKDNPSMALVLLDVVMEQDNSGLILVDRIRNELGNHLIQIILRTGQPGDTPEEDLITRYEINSYKTKNELTRSKLFTSVASGLRSFKLLYAMNNSRNGLRDLIQASGCFLQQRSVNDFSNEVLTQFTTLFEIANECVFCVSKMPLNGPVSLSVSDQNINVLATTSGYSKYVNKSIEKLDKAIFIQASLVFESKEHVFNSDYGCLYFSTPSGWEGVIIVDQGTELQDVDEEFLQIFCLNVAMGLENAEYFNHLNKAAYKDELTGLKNRVGFIEHASHLLKPKLRQHSLYLLDIDYFHQVITSLGYEFGNLILKKMAVTLVHLFGEGTIIARLHSDVFAVLVVNSKLEAREVAAKCSRPVVIEGQSIRMGLTVGVALTQDGDDYIDDISKLISRAEMALHVAKEHKRGSGEVYDKAYEQESYQSMMLLSDFRAGVTREELFLVLQPKVDISVDKVIGYEALIRWMHPSKKLIPPGAFIPSVEKSGMYYELDLYVARALCKILNKHPDLNVPVSFNISANSLNHDSFVYELKNVFIEEKIDFSRVEIEVTENALIHSEQAISRISALYDAGFKIGLDDFGAGFSSLAYLLRLPLHTIKIDRSFVADIVDQPASLILLEGILDILCKLNKDIVIEGVETEKQRDILAKLGMKVVQGFLYYKPLPVVEAISLLKND